MVSGSFSLLCSRFFSPFLHSTGSLSVSREYLALRDGPRSVCFRLRGCHPLRLRFPSYSANFLACLCYGSFYPGPAVTAPVWALPRSLATTCGIIVIFFSCGYLDVSVPRVGLPLGGMVIADRVAPFGYLRVTGYLRLSVTFRSLSRPSSPPRA